MIASTTEIMNKGMKCLTEQLGMVGAEQFIAAIMREQFDYTKWQRDYFDVKTPQEISREAVEFAKAHPYEGSAQRV